MAEENNPNNAPQSGEELPAEQVQQAAPSENIPQAAEINEKDIPDYLQELPVKVDVLLGSVKLTVKELLKCGPGSVIDVGKRVSDAFDLYVNNVLVARGEVVTMHDRLGLKVTEVIEKPPFPS